MFKWIADTFYHRDKNKRNKQERKPIIINLVTQIAAQFPEHANKYRSTYTFFHDVLAIIEHDYTVESEVKAALMLFYTFYHNESMLAIHTTINQEAKMYFDTVRTSPFGSIKYPIRCDVIGSNSGLFESLERSTELRTAWRPILEEVLQIIDVRSTQLLVYRHVHSVHTTFPEYLVSRRSMEGTFEIIQDRVNWLLNLDAK